MLVRPLPRSLARPLLAGSEAPPVDQWQEFVLTAGVSISWVGYIRDADEIAAPSGSIDREANPAHELLILVWDPALQATAVRFRGDVTAWLDSQALTIDGDDYQILEASNYDAEGDYTDAMFLGPEFEGGESYQISLLNPVA